MKTRKLVLLIADALLFAFCIIQGIFSLHDTTKYFELKDGVIDEICIDTPEEKGILIVKDGEDWFVSQKKYPANISVVDSFINAMSSIRVLDKVGSTGNDAVLERYELNDSKKTVVTVKGAGKVLRTIEIGKKAMSDTQSYITVDGGKDIYLATGNLPYIFDTITSAIRTEIVMTLDSSEISGVTLDDGETSWTVSKMGSGDDIVWNFTGAAEGLEVDAEKAFSWFNTISSLTTKSWYEEGNEPLGSKILSVKISHAFKTSTIEFYEIFKNDESASTEYFGLCSESPYAFTVNKNVYEKFVKDAEDLAK